MSGAPARSRNGPLGARTPASNVPPQRPRLSLAHRSRPPAIRAAQDAPPPLLILLHGIGGNELAMAALAGSFDARFLVLSPRAPIELKPFAFGWLNVTFTAHGPVIDGDEAIAAWTGMAAFVDEAVEAYRADANRVFLAGFSQGGILALMTLLTAPERVAGAVCMSGRLPGEVLPHVAPPDRLRGKPALIVHGREDQTLPIEYGRAANGQLRRLQLDVEYRELDLGHTTTDASIALVSAWLSARLDA